MKSIDLLPKASLEILERCSGKKIFAVQGEMGSGKTTLIKNFCEHLGLLDSALSPTFSMVNEYMAREKIFHIDLYRLKTLNEAIEIGIEEYLSEKEYCFIEWPELVSVLLPPSTVQINLKVEDSGERIINVINEF